MHQNQSRPEDNVMTSNTRVTLFIENNFNKFKTEFYLQCLPEAASGTWSLLVCVCMLRCVLIFIEGSRSLSQNNVIGIIIVTTGGNISTMGNNNNNIQ